jgi:hypothetical protein
VHQQQQFFPLSGLITWISQWHNILLCFNAVNFISISGDTIHLKQSDMVHQAICATVLGDGSLYTAEIWKYQENFPFWLYAERLKKYQ